MLWEHEVVGSNPTAPTNSPPAMRAVRCVVACADVLTHLQVRSHVCSPTPCGQPALPAEDPLGSEPTGGRTQRPTRQAGSNLPDRDRDGLDAVVAHALVVPGGFERLHVAV